MASKKIANPSAVREWARENLSSIEGLPAGYTVARQGRLHPAIQAAFNKAHPKAKYVVGVHEPETVEVKTFRVSASGRRTPLVKRVEVSKARAAAVAAGATVGKRGRLTKAVLTAYALGEYDTPQAPEAPESE